jgi:hypothetical protein
MNRAKFWTRQTMDRANSAGIPIKR